MWRKVISKRQLELLKVGDLLVKYPLDGGALDRFDDAHSENVSPRIVAANDREDRHMRLSFLHSKSPNDPILGMYKGLLAPVLRTYDEMIGSGLWWVFNE